MEIVRPPEVLSRREQRIEADITGLPLLPRPVEKALVTAVAKQYARGVVGAARVETTRKVASHALRALEDLEREEAASVARDPMNAGHRQRVIVDTAAAVFNDAVRLTGAASHGF